MKIFCHYSLCAAMHFKDAFLFFCSEHPCVHFQIKGYQNTKCLVLGQLIKV